MLSFCAVVPAGFFRGPVLLGYLLFFGGGLSFFGLFFLYTIYFGLLRMSRVYFGVMVYPQFVPVHNVLSNQVTNIYFVVLVTSRFLPYVRSEGFPEYLISRSIPDTY